LGTLTTTAERLAVANFGDNTVGIYIDSGTAAFNSHESSMLAADRFLVAAGDFNGDGYLDIAAAITAVTPLLSCG
jgi:hypothetical protein